MRARRFEWVGAAAVADEVRAWTSWSVGLQDVAAIEQEVLRDGDRAVLRLTASFYVGRPARQIGGIEFHGDAGSLALGNFQDFDTTVEVGKTYRYVVRTVAAA